MGWKRGSLELAVRLWSLAVPRPAEPPGEPRSIFVLRNNDIGDLLVVTPLFEALKKRFPRARIAAGVGSWNFDVLKNNPFVDEILPVNAPWHNGRIAPQGLRPALDYIAASPEMKNIARHRFDIGIDVLGSPFGSMLLMRAGIPFRMGVEGYAGGQSGVQRHVVYDPREHVAAAALRFARLLGAEDLPEARPRIYPDAEPQSSGAIVIAPGGGFADKCWPLENFIALAGMLGPRKTVVIGGEGDRAAAGRIAEAGANVENLAGKLSLRETFGVVAASSLVVCNSSMAMHVAAAFRKPCIVLLGAWYPSASVHAAQWAYPETRVIGREGDGGIASPAGVMEIIRAL